MIKKTSYAFQKSRKILALFWDHSNPILETEEDICNYVIVKYIFAIFLAIFSIFISIEFADIINQQNSFTPNQIKIFQTLSVAIMAIGVWGQPGWKIQSWTGK